MVLGRGICNEDMLSGLLAAGTPCTDSDADGMPDAWETLNGFNPSDSSDGRADADGDGYTNLEEFLHRTTP